MSDYLISQLLQDRGRNVWLKAEIRRRWKASDAEIEALSWRGFGRSAGGEAVMRPGYEFPSGAYPRRAVKEGEVVARLEREWERRWRIPYGEFVRSFPPSQRIAVTDRLMALRAARYLEIRGLTRRSLVADVGFYCNKRNKE